MDPLATSAWNALLSGHKRWALFPPGTAKEVSAGPWSLHGSPWTAPVVAKPSCIASVPRLASQLVLPKEPGLEREAASWFSRVFPRTRAPDWPTARPLTVIQRPGETMFVPGGWWHAVLNLDLTVAVTQNYGARARTGGWKGVRTCVWVCVCERACVRVRAQVWRASSQQPSCPGSSRSVLLKLCEGVAAYAHGTPQDERQGRLLLGEGVEGDSRVVRVWTHMRAVSDPFQ